LYRLGLFPFSGFHQIAACKWLIQQGNLIWMGPIGERLRARPTYCSFIISSSSLPDPVTSHKKRQKKSKTCRASTSLLYMKSNSYGSQQGTGTHTIVSPQFFFFFFFCNFKTQLLT
jgi:hypothetical protein